VIGHHHEAATGAQDALRSFEELFESRQLAIDLDTQRLEGSFGRVPATAARRCGHRLTDELGQVLGADHRLPGLTPMHDGGGDAGGEPLLAVGAQDAAELDGVGGLQQVLGGHS